MGFTSSNCVLNPFKIAGMLHWKLFAARSFNVLNSSYDHFGCYESVFYNIYRLYKIGKYLYHTVKKNIFITDIVITIWVDPDLIQSVFSSNFHAFPTRWPGGGTFGRGPIFGRTLDVISDIPSWKRLRSTLSPGFSTKQLNQMLHAIEATIGTLLYYII